MGWVIHEAVTGLLLAKAVDSYVVHFSEEAWMRKRLGVGAEKFGISRGSSGIDCG